MTVYLYFNENTITPPSRNKEAKYLHLVPCVSVRMKQSYLEDTLVIRITFTPDQLGLDPVRLVVKNREIKRHADLLNEFIEIPYYEVGEAHIINS